MLKTFVIHGVGIATFYDFSSGREVLRLKRQETASWTIGYDEVDVMGGDDIDLFETFETGRTQSVSFTNNEFDIRMLEAATGKRPYESYSAPVVDFNEGLFIPDSPGPYTYDLDHSTADAATVRVRYSETREDLAPVPQVWGTANLAEATGSTFSAGTVDVRITAVLPSGLESCATAAAAIVLAGSADIEVTAPSEVLTLPSSLPQYDVEVTGYNIYVDDGVAAEYLSNSTPVAAGEVHTLLATPGDGAASPDTTPTVAGQFTVAAGVVTFAEPDAGEGVLIDYVWTTSASVVQAETVDILSNCLRRWMKCIWRMSFQTKDGREYGLQAIIHKMKYTGDFTIDFNRADASSHDLEYKIIDPERPDKKIVTWTVLDLGDAETC